MKKILLDIRIKNIFLKYFKEKEIDCIFVESVENIYDEISSHVDIFSCKVKNQIICAKNIKLTDYSFKFLEGSNIENNNFVKYNFCITKKFVIGNFKYIDEVLKRTIEENELEKINVKQGYAKCNILALTDNAYITSDNGIKNVLEKYGFDVLYLPDEDIKLLDKNGKFSNMRGFIGGATCIIDNEVILFGDVKFLKQGKAFEKFIEKYGYTLKYFENEEIVDYGSAIYIG